MRKVKKKKLEVKLSAKSRENRVDRLIVDLETSQNTYKNETQCK